MNTLKTLYININGEAIQSDENIEVIGSTEDAIIDSFYISLGMAIADGVTGIKYKPLVSDFAKAKPEEFKSFTDQWNELKAVLLGENPSGDFEFILSPEYLEWLKMNVTYSTIYYKKYQKRHPIKVKVSLDELYEDSVDVICRKVLRFLYKSDNYKGFDRFVVNDETVTIRSLLVRSVQSKFDNISFVSYGEIEPPQPIVQPVHIEKIKLPNADDIVDISHFENGYAIVKYFGLRWGYIDTAGREVLHLCGYHKISPFQNGKAYVLIDNIEGAVINLKGEIIKKLPNGHRLFNHTRQFSEGMCAYLGFDKWGYINQDGELVIPYRYDEVFDFSGGVAKVHIWGSPKGDYAYINKKGETIILSDSNFCVPKIDKSDTPPNNQEPYISLNLVGRNIIGVKDDMDNWLIPQIYTSLESIGENFILAKRGTKVTDLYKLNGRAFKNIDFIKRRDEHDTTNHSNEIVISNEDINRLKIISINNRGFRLFPSGDKIREINELDMGYYVRSGQVLYEFSIKETKESNKENDTSLFVIERNGLFGYANNDGEIVLRCVYDCAKPFSEGLAAVKIGSNWGFINVNGVVEIDFIYSDVGSFKNGICLVTEGHLGQNVIDKKGRSLINFIQMTK